MCIRRISICTYKYTLFYYSPPSLLLSPFHSPTLGNDEYSILKEDVERCVPQVVNLTLSNWEHNVKRTASIMPDIFQALIALVQILELKGQGGGAAISCQTFKNTHTQTFTFKT